jgi:hypothetical protein
VHGAFTGLALWLELIGILFYPEETPFYSDFTLFENQCFTVIQILSLIYVKLLSSSITVYILNCIDVKLSATFCGEARAWRAGAFGL